MKLVIQPPPYVLWVAVWFHWILGLCLTQSPSEVGALLVLAGLEIPYKVLNEVRGWIGDVPYVSLPDYGVLGLVLIAIATFAALGLLNESKLNRKGVLIALAPQYFLVLATLLSDTWLIASGEYANVVRDRWLLLSVLALVIVVAAFHSYNVLERYFVNWKR